RLDPAALSVLPEVRPRARLLLGGPGWRAAAPQVGVRRVEDLASGVQLVLDAVGLDPVERRGAAR
ncbi:MAG: hypothetical protein QOE40_288, partial [Actinomycetota bacterium]|nr:hypothetical protein [Actinomycetota bacterium]